jgi:hypothetical protein
MSEHEEQVEIFKWAKFKESAIPGLQLMFAVPNGGLRNKKVAANLKKEGVKAGVPDIMLPVPRGKFHGLFIELKFGKNKPTATQVWWLDRLLQEKYAVKVCYGAGEAIEIITKYLAMESE